jgi:class 3 adenylate cyclase
MQEFLTGTTTAPVGENSVQTILFSDIVKSTETAATLGDQRWTDLLNSYYAVVRAELAVFRGKEIDTAGDGFVASFDGPARGIRCACAVMKSLQHIGVNARLGLHTGECEVRAGRLTGIALHIAARVSALAPAGGVLVSQTVKDLVAGAGLKFSDAGLHVLKGLPEQWRLYNVVA